ncbi:hypothetical protein GCM10027168_56290 [Streptomyces capparidis]
MQAALPRDEAGLPDAEELHRALVTTSGCADRSEKAGDRHISAQRDLFNRFMGMLHYYLRHEVIHDESRAFPSHQCPERPARQPDSLSVSDTCRLAHTRARAERAERAEASPDTMSRSNAVA